jgi:hypothetical protein
MSHPARITRLRSSTLWCIERGVEQLRLCPCCGDSFRTEGAASKALAMIAYDTDGAWPEAMAYQDRLLQRRTRVS